MPFRLLVPLALVGLATPLAAQSRGIRTYANPVDLDIEAFDENGVSSPSSVIHVR